MIEFFKSFFRTAEDRFNNPISGAVAVSWIIWNWKSIAYFFLSRVEISQRIETIHDTYSQPYLLDVFVPLMLAFGYLTVAPYASLGVDKLTIKATLGAIESERVKKRYREAENENLTIDNLMAQVNALEAEKSNLLSKNTKLENELREQVDINTVLENEATKQEELEREIASFRKLLSNQHDRIKQIISSIRPGITRVTNELQTIVNQKSNDLERNKNNRKGFPDMNDDNYYDMLHSGKEDIKILLEEKDLILSKLKELEDLQ